MLQVQLPAYMLHTHVGMYCIIQLPAYTCYVHMWVCTYTCGYVLVSCLHMYWYYTYTCGYVLTHVGMYWYYTVTCLYTRILQNVSPGKLVIKSIIILYQYVGTFAIDMAGGWKSDFTKIVKQQLSRVNPKVMCIST